VISGVPDELALAADERGVRTARMLVEPDRIGLRGLTDLVESGKLRVHVEQTFPLEQVATAHELVEAGHVTGKVVLTMLQDPISGRRG
jgi:NADPH:quinone reductase-like Zn-dependent oxidoreductase